MKATTRLCPAALLALLLPALGTPTARAQDAPAVELDVPSLLGAQVAPVTAVTSLDLDADGDVDVVACGTSVGFYLQGAGGTWTYAAGPSVGASCRAVVVGDFDDDGNDDLAVLGSNALVVLYMEGNGARTQATVLSSGSISGVLVAGDVTGDAVPDLTTHYSGALQHWLAPGPGRGAWSVQQGVALPAATHLAAQDMDGDDLVDIGYLDTTSNAAGLILTAPLGAGTRTGYAHPADPRGIAFARAYLPGQHELYAWSPSWGIVEINSPSNTNATTGTQQDGVSLGDMDADGWAEAVGFADGQIHVWESRVISGFARYHGSTPFTPTGTVRSALGDVDGDGDLELLVADGAGAHLVMNRTPHGPAGVSILTGPDDGARGTDAGPRAPVAITVAHGGQAGDAAMGIGELWVAGRVDGVALTPIELAAAVELSVWFDVDGDGAFDPVIDARVPSDVSAMPGWPGVRMVSRSQMAPGGAEPSGPLGRWFIAAQPTAATTLGAYATLELSVRADLVYPATLLGVAPVVRDALTGDAAGTLRVGNTPLTAPALYVSVTEGGTVDFDAVSGTSDADGDTVSLVRLLGDPSVGSAMPLVALNHVRYTHDGGEAPEVGLLAELTDGVRTLQRSIVIEVHPTDDPPTASALTVYTLAGQALTFDLSGGDVDDDERFEVVTPPGAGTLVAVSADGRTVTYTPTTAAAGTDSFEFAVRGGALLSASATVTVFVSADSGDDDDADGVPDGLDNCASVPNADQRDLDRDGLGDVCDDDDDGDGVPDTLDVCPELPYASRCGDDVDEDGVPFVEDNCPFDANEDQADLDRDGRGDVCDDDDDGDLVPDAIDNCPTVPNRTQANVDRDSSGDACDDDIDGDGVANADDDCPWAADADQEDSDEDGVGDACDGDADSDGVPTEDDCNDNDPTTSALWTYYEDSDGDGLGAADAPVEACSLTAPAGASWEGTDNCPDVANPDQLDSDGDRLGDACDPDARSSGCAVAPRGGSPSLFFLFALAAGLALCRGERRRKFHFGSSGPELPSNSKW